MKWVELRSYKSGWSLRIGRLYLKYNAQKMYGVYSIEYICVECLLAKPGYSEVGGKVII